MRRIQETEARIAQLQGEWVDDAGINVKVSGFDVHFSDSAEPAKLEDTSAGALVLRKGRLIGPGKAPSWKFDNGILSSWARLDSATPGGGHWGEAFIRYKENRLQLRRQLQTACESQDIDLIRSLTALWESHDELVGLTALQNTLLLEGRCFVPGVCIKHRVANYRAVIVGCEPWCYQDAAWRAKHVPNRPEGEAQPFYHCVVDERDVGPGAQIAYVAQEHLEKHDADASSLVEGPLVDELFIRCDSIGGYLPGSDVDDALTRQSISGRFGD